MRLTMKKARQIADLRQIDVAKAMGVHVQTYMKWERNPGEMTIMNAQRFSRIVGRSFDEIFFDAESNLIRHEQHNTA